jgi:hypothetical protein
MAWNINYPRLYVLQSKGENPFPNVGWTVSGSPGVKNAPTSLLPYVPTSTPGGAWEHSFQPRGTFHTAIGPDVPYGATMVGAKREHLKPLDCRKRQFQSPKSTLWLARSGVRMKDCYH